MLALVLAATAVAPIERDAYGVPHIVAETWGEAFYHAGYAAAEDRLWQMENSRRLSQGRMAEAFGPDFAPSDREVLKVSYTDDELRKQLAALPPRIMEAFQRYADGVNAFIAAGKLPEGYAKAGLQPEPWTPTDSAAIAVRLFQIFGRGGAGEIRNLALYSYLSMQPAIKGRELDVVDDLAWFNEAKATTTVAPEDDPLNKRAPTFYVPDRKATAAHLAQIPKLGILELLPGVRLAERFESTLVAQDVSAPYKVGSYCIAVSRERSATGKAMLLSGPQMGFANPSIVHEMSIRAPGIAAVGMDVPGVPGIVVGHTKHVAWGITSGVADTDDIFFIPTSGAEAYKDGDVAKPIEVLSRTLKVKGKPDEVVEQRRTRFGPVVLTPRSQPVLFCRKSASWGRELESVRSIFAFYEAKSADDVTEAAKLATTSYNVFAADLEGNIGYRYAGLVPIRAEAVDPRFPTPAGRDWGGFIPPESMPHAKNPKSGLFVNWNNKPATWWPHGDTPAWGEIFRDRVLRDNLTRSELTVEDLELAIWTAARTDYNYALLRPYTRGLSAELDAFDGRRFDGSTTAPFYNAYYDALREELFAPNLGGLLTPENFKAIVQPSLLLRALERKTKFDYFGKRTPKEVEEAAWKKASERVGPGERFTAPGIRISGQPPIPYSDRGTYIQVIELLSTPSGRNVLPPGVTETGEHSQDQVPLARAWTYKPMVLR